MAVDSKTLPQPEPEYKDPFPVFKPRGVENGLKQIDKIIQDYSEATWGKDKKAFTPKPEAHQKAVEQLEKMGHGSSASSWLHRVSEKPATPAAAQPRKR